MNIIIAAGLQFSGRWYSFYKDKLARLENAIERWECVGGRSQISVLPADSRELLSEDELKSEGRP